MNTGIKSSQKGPIGVFHKLLAANLESILAIPGKKLYRQFETASLNVEAQQMSTLREILSHNRDTVFGRERGFDQIRTWQDYRASVPVQDYEDLRPYVNRHVNGESNVLFQGRPYIYTRTSGTTAEPKLIPISQFNFDRTIKNRSKLWLHALSRNFPGIFSGKDFTLVSPAVDGHTEDGVPFGSLSGMMYRNIPEFMKLVHTIPYEVLCIRDFDAKAYTLLRFGVPSRVTSIFTGNPSTVLNMAQKGDLWKERLIRDVRDGTLDPSFHVEPEIRKAAEAMLSPAPENARRLEAIAEHNDRFRPAEYWPDLRLIHTWTNGNCHLVIPGLRQWFREDTPVVDFGFIASEINATDIVDPATNGSLLAIRSGFYEFSPESEGETPSTFLMAHQLKKGQRYYVYVTTYSGLYRYNMNDVLEVVDHFNQVPVLRFLYKGKGITSIAGEKLSEEQLIEAVQMAAASTGVRHDFFVACANFDKRRYDLFIELLDALDPSRIQAFAQKVDEALSKVNIEYQARRDSQRLQPVQITLLPGNAFARYRRLRLEGGAFEGQLKWLHLSGTEATRDRMMRLSDPSNTRL